LTKKDSKQSYKEVLTLLPLRHLVCVSAMVFCVSLPFVLEQDNL
jgi:hypothetical protein